MITYRFGLSFERSSREIVCLLRIDLCFRKLRFLNLNNTELSTWDEIDRLAKFPALTSLRVQVRLFHVNIHFCIDRYWETIRWPIKVSILKTNAIER